jgi:hypothetical protein
MIEALNKIYIEDCRSCNGSHPRFRYPKKQLLDSKPVLKVYFKPRRKNLGFLFLPYPILHVSVKIGHLIVQLVTLGLPNMSKKLQKM